MILKVVVPAHDAAFRAGYVEKWFKEPGDPVEFGEVLCDIAIDEFMALQRTKRATLLGSSKKLRKRKITDGYDRREGRGLVHIHIISSEANTQMGKILVSEGGRIEIGSVVGLLGADGDAVDLERVPPARIAVDMPKASVVEPFDDDLEDD
ncbi:MAG TPA: hypothetical protein VLG28_17700 [Acidimicrobiia bacterium]|jgi:hypothetical protein|nr:hypothetical protein [Acidimicrobiia bacterium]